MIPRYSREPMARIWSEDNKFAAWLKVELAVLEALAETGLIPAEVPDRVKGKAQCDIERILAIEQAVPCIARSRLLENALEVRRTLQHLN